MPLRDRESVRRLARSQGQRGAKVLASAATSNAAPLVPEVVQAQR
jgi:hypothetical protein